VQLIAAAFIASRSVLATRVAAPSGSKAQSATDPLTLAAMEQFDQHAQASLKPFE